jgi:hypothetical protein
MLMTTAAIFHIVYTHKTNTVCIYRWHHHKHYIDTYSRVRKSRAYHNMYAVCKKTMSPEAAKVKARGAMSKVV